MTWHIRAVEHRTTVYVTVDPPRLVRAEPSGQAYQVEAVEFEYVNGQPQYGLTGMHVLARRIMSDGRPRSGSGRYGGPVRILLDFTRHGWLEGMRLRIDLAYNIDRASHDTPVRGADVADPDTQAA